MPKSKVTSKFQVTIPKEVREKIGVRPGELVTVEAVSEAEILLKRFAIVKDPVGILIGRPSKSKPIAIEELEEGAEVR